MPSAEHASRHEPLRVKSASVLAKNATTESEAALQARAVELLTYRHWRCFHVSDSRRADAGVWDLLCLRERLVFIECKRGKEKLTTTEIMRGPRGLYIRFGQVEFGELLDAAGIEKYILRPSTFDEVMEAMK